MVLMRSFTLSLAAASKEGSGFAMRLSPGLSLSGTAKCFSSLAAADSALGGLPAASAAVGWGITIVW